MPDYAQITTAAEVRDFLADILPLGVPTYLRRVMSVGPHPEDPGGFKATVELFDGGLMFVKSNVPLSEGHYRFGFPTGETPFRWDRRRREWRRLPSFSADDQVLFLRSVDRLFKALA